MATNTYKRQWKENGLVEPERWLVAHQGHSVMQMSPVLVKQQKVEQPLLIVFVQTGRALERMSQSYSWLCRVSTAPQTIDCGETAGRLQAGIKSIVPKHHIFSKCRVLLISTKNHRSQDQSLSLM